MAGKINRIQKFHPPVGGLNLKLLIFVILFFILVYTRFVNIGWGLPYPMHPDERNMAVAIQGLNCEISNSKFQISNCFNPHFFAYGQLPLYLGYLLIIFYKFLVGIIKTPVSFIEATISLRIISATASVINVFVLFNIVQLILPISKIKDKISKLQIKNQKFYIFLYHFSFCFLIFTLVPYAIQFSHFGTTESLLMLFYSLIVYYSFLFIDKKIKDKKFIILSALFAGLAIATKVSSLIFVAVPIITIIFSEKKVKKFLILSLNFAVCTLIFALVFSPHNLISWQEFISSIKYESMVATGKVQVFYSRQFVQTIPVLFQLLKIFPYVLGWPLYLLFILGFIFLSWKDKKINILRFSFLVYFIPNAFLFAKWTRFMAPIFPLMTIFSILFISKIKDKISKPQIKNQKFLFLICYFTFYILIFILVFPGIYYLKIYQRPDVRFQASEWIYKNVPNKSVILSETANVVNLPLQGFKTDNFYKVINFNFYELDSSSKLQEELKEYLKKADYIIVPSRRIFMNHACKNFQFSIFPTLPRLRGASNFQSIFNEKCQIFKKKFPLLNNYYEALFDGKLGFEKTAEFSSGFVSDEQAEETFSVFDHPIIRIYKKEF